jgi:hypothetical protein
LRLIAAGPQQAGWLPLQRLFLLPPRHSFCISVLKGRQPNLVQEMVGRVSVIVGKIAL